MLRNFIRDRGTQLTLGTFVATFVYAVLALVAIGTGRTNPFVPHISITVALALVLVDGRPDLLHQPHRELDPAAAGDREHRARPRHARSTPRRGAGESAASEPGPRSPSSRTRMDEIERRRAAPASGYLQFVRYDTLVRIAARERRHPPATPSRPLRRRGPPAGDGLAAGGAPTRVTRSLERAHVTGPYRTLTQDLAFAVDQLVEIAIRALSPAVNDTFTALTCIDWLGREPVQDRRELAPDPRPSRRRAAGPRDHRARSAIDRLVERSFEKIRQASRGMPAVMIRQLDALRGDGVHDDRAAARRVVEQARMILRAARVGARGDRPRRRASTPTTGWWPRARRWSWPGRADWGAQRVHGRALEQPRRRAASSTPHSTQPSAVVPTPDVLQPGGEDDERDHRSDVAVGRARGDQRADQHRRHAPDDERRRHTELDVPERERAERRRERQRDRLGRGRCRRAGWRRASDRGTAAARSSANPSRPTSSRRSRRRSCRSRRSAAGARRCRGPRPSRRAAAPVEVRSAAPSPPRPRAARRRARPRLFSCAAWRCPIRCSR